MKSKISTLILAIVYIAFSSCNRSECRNTNLIFDKFSPDTKEYKTELAKQIQNVGAENLSYWHDKYLKKDGAEYIVIYIQGQGLCAKGEIQVTDWSKIIGMRGESSGYRGAKLEGLNFKIIQDSRGTNFLYKDIDRVVD
ncbi:MAG: hypothetical protein JWN76_985 [Chitinophagaceae bacterium]|nr:hypothetical protein [Chitinophagaceae bacterium]